jgi:glycosyltransferase involved in cell wall biosynthesis
MEDIGTNARHGVEANGTPATDEMCTAAVAKRHVVLVSLGRGPGDPRAMQKEARSLDRSGYDVTYVCNAGSGPPVADDHVHIRPVELSRSRLLRQTRGPGVMLHEAMLARPDALHVFDPALIRPAIRLGRRHGLRVVVDLPEDSPKQILQKSYLGPMVVRRLVSRAYHGMSQSLLPKSSLVIAATPSIAASVPAGCHCITVRNFPEVSEIDAVPALTSAGRGTYGSPLRLVYVGGISSIRGIRELVLAVGMMHGTVELHLAGPVHDDAFMKAMESLPAWQYCTYHGWLSWQDSIGLIKTCDLGACILQAAPNQIEALPVKVFEYMACSRGSIVSSFPLWRRLFAGAAMFVEPTDVASLARMLELLRAEPVLLHRLAEQGRVLAETRYSWESEARELVSGYAGMWTAR